VHDVGRQLPVKIVRNELGRHQAAEGSLINEPEFASIIIETNAHAKMLLVCRIIRLHEELTAHTEVRDKRRAVVEWQPQVLAPPTHASHGATHECGSEWAFLPAHGTLVQDINSANGS
jgi:hypothetical protein